MNFVLKEGAADLDVPALRRPQPASSPWAFSLIAAAAVVLICAWFFLPRPMRKRVESGRQHTDIPVAAAPGYVVHSEPIQDRLYRVN